MSATNRDTAIRATLGYEGGYSDNPHDPGGPTNYGITLADARLHWKKDATAQDVREMPIGVAVGIYQGPYWTVPRLDEVPTGPDFATFDYNVNSGVSRGVKALQKATGAKVDGVAGDETIGAAMAADPVATVKAICASRLSFLHALRTWEYFKGGWGRRVADVEARGVKMALEAKGSNAQLVQKELQRHAVEATAQAKKEATKGALVPAAAGATQATPHHVDLTTLPHSVLIVGGIVLACVVFYFGWKAYQHKQRAAAYVAVAAGK